MSEQEKLQPELRDIFNAIDKWVAVNEGHASCVCGFCAFDKEKIDRDEKDITKDDGGRTIIYGIKECALIQAEELTQLIKSYPHDFIENWSDDQPDEDDESGCTFITLDKEAAKAYAAKLKAGPGELTAGEAKFISKVEAAVEAEAAQDDE